MTALKLRLKSALCAGPMASGAYRSVFGGLRQTSVSGGAVIVKDDMLDAHSSRGKRGARQPSVGASGSHVLSKRFLDVAVDTAGTV